MCWYFKSFSIFTLHSIPIFIYTYEITINATLDPCQTLVYVLDLLADQSLIMRPHIGHMSAAISENSIPYLGYVLSGIIAFILTWIATSLLMRHHSARLGKIKYWLIVCIPLGYFSANSLIHC